MYKRNGDNGFIYSKRRGQWFYYSNTLEKFPIALAAPVSMSMVANSYKSYVQALKFNIFPLIDALSDFEDAPCWDNLSDGLDTAINDPTILLDKYKPIYLFIMYG